MKGTNRQKRELIKRIRELETWIEIDTAMGCGFAPPGAYDEAYKEIDRLQEELAHLMHYKSTSEMFYDECGQISVDEILRQSELGQSQKHRKGPKRGARSDNKMPRKNSRETVR